jgi:hypothetical protein
MRSSNTWDKDNPARMKTTAVAFLSVVGYAAAQGVSAAISPSAPPPPGCTGTFDGNFEVQVRKPLSKKDLPVQVSPPFPGIEECDDNNHSKS